MNAASPDATAAVCAADDARHRAMMDHDLAALDRLLSPDMVYTHATARRETKAEYLQSLRGGRVRYLHVERSGASVRFHGTAAVMIGQSAIHAISDGTEKRFSNLFQSVWSLAPTGWQMCAWTSVLVPAASVVAAPSALPGLEQAHA